MVRIGSQDINDVRIAHEVLSWIVCATRPLLIKEVQHALAVDPESTEIDAEVIIDEALLLSVCLGLVTVDRESQIIRLIHYTTQEYLQRTCLQHFPDFQENITSTCLDYISRYIPWESLTIHDRRGKNYFKVREKAKEWQSQYPLLDYAIQNWGFHAQGPVEYSLSDLIIGFFSNEIAVSRVGQMLGYLLWGRDRLVVVRIGDRLSALQIAVFFNLQTTMIALIDKGIDVNEDGRWGGTALHTAVDRGDLSTMRLLLEHGAKPDLEDSLEMTALQHAVFAKNDAAVQLLLQHGADMTLKDRKGTTALCSAVREESIDVVQAFFTSGIKPLNGAVLEAAMYIATSEGSTGIVHLLLKNHPDSEMLPCVATNLLLHAVRCRQVSTVQLLLENKANIETTCEQGKTTLHYVAAYGDLDMLKLLLENGTDSEKRDHSGWTALQYAARRGHLAIMNLLLEHGASAEMRNDDIGTALCKAIERGHEKAASLLRHHGAQSLWREVESAYDRQIWVVKIFGNKSNLREVLERRTELSGSELEREISSWNDVSWKIAVLPYENTVRMTILDWMQSQSYPLNEIASMPSYLTTLC